MALLVVRAKATIEKYNMIGAGSSVLAAVSGGADSVALAHVLSRLTPALDFRLQLAHLNHGIRGDESDADAAFVEEVASGLGASIITEKVDARALAEAERRSLEDACRQARRRFLLHAAEESGCSVIATGHHSDDQAETVLLRLMRGTGVTGLAAIQPVTPEGFIRPLLECRRRDIRRFLGESEIPYREDSSNLDMMYMRNRVRHELIPLLERQFSPAIVDVLCRVSSNMADVDKLLSQIGLKALNEAAVESECDRMSLDLSRLRSYDEITWRYVFRMAYRALVGDSQGLTHGHLQSMVDLVRRRPTGTAIHLPGGIRARKGYGVVQVYRERPARKPGQVERTVRVPGVTRVPELGGALETQLIHKEDLPPDLRTTAPTVAFFDMMEISSPLSVRVRKEGDRIQPFGFHGTKKLKDLLIELKVPLEVRDRLPLLTDGQGVLWVAGVKRSDRAKILPSTTDILEARWREGD